MTNLNRREALQALVGTALVAALPLPTLAPAAPAVAAPAAAPLKAGLDYLLFTAVRLPEHLQFTNCFHIELVDSDDPKHVADAEARWKAQYPNSEVVACVFNFKEAMQLASCRGESHISDVLYERVKNGLEISTV